MKKGAYRVGKWGHEGQKELSVYSVFIVGSYHWITWLGSNTWQCDNTLEKLLHLVTSGESMSVDNFATLSLLHSRTFSIYF